MLTRRTFLAALSCLPFAGKFVKPAGWHYTFARFEPSEPVTPVPFVGGKRALTWDEMEWLSNDGKGRVYSDFEYLN